MGLHTEFALNVCDTHSTQISLNPVRRTLLCGIRYSTHSGQAPVPPFFRGPCDPQAEATGELAVRDRRAALVRQSAVIAKMKEVTAGKVVIILDQDPAVAEERAGMLALGSNCTVCISLAEARRSPYFPPSKQPFALYFRHN